MNFRNSSDALGQAIRVTVRKHSDVRGKGLLGRVIFQAAEHPSFARGPQDAMVGKMDPSEKIDAGSEALDKNLLWMKGELESFPKKPVDLRNKIFEILPVTGENREVVGVPEIILDLQFVLHELVEFVHVNVHEELRGEVAERQSRARSGRRKTADHLAEKPPSFPIRYIAPQDFRQHAMVDARKKFSDVAFQDPHRFRVIRAFLSGERTEAVQCLVGSFIYAT